MIKPILNKLFWGVFRHFLSDKQYARYRYWLEFDRLPDLENPQRFTEKIQYIKLNERTALRKKVADRMKVRTYVADKIGEDYLVPLIGKYDKITPEIWAELPGRFVMKANHGCQMNLIVKDKKAESIEDVQALTQKWQQTDYYTFGREWVYKDLPRTLIVEKLLLTENEEIPYDFKFYCLHGKVELIQVDFNRFGQHFQQIINSKFELLDVKIRHEVAHEEIQMPANFDEMISVAEKLSSDFNFIRVDLYSVREKIYFGELTNYPGNGFSPFTPHEYDLKLGQKLKLDSV